MAKKKEQKTWLYKKYRQDNKKEEEIRVISEKLEITQDKVVIKKVSSFAKIIEILADSFFVFLKIVFYLVIMALVSFALTILINQQLRETVFATFKAYF